MAHNLKETPLTHFLKRKPHTQSKDVEEDLNTIIVIPPLKDNIACYQSSKEADVSLKWIFTPIEFILKIIWDLIVIIAAIGLTIAWIGFLFGSVLGVVLVLIFIGLEGFLFPLGLLGLVTNPTELWSLDS